MSAPQANDIRQLTGFPARIWLPLAVAVIITLAIFVISELSYSEFTSSRSRMGEGLATRALILQLEKALLDAESAQRGFLLTRQDDYLEPYEKAVERIRPLQMELRDALSDDKAFRETMAKVTELIALKTAEMNATLTAMRTGDATRAHELVDGNEGRALMARIREHVGEIDRIVSRRVEHQGAEWFASIETNRRAIFTVVALNIVLIGSVVLLVMREMRQRSELMKIIAAHAANLERDVAERTEELSSLSAFLQTSTEHERAGLARELHDELGAILTPARMDVDYLQERLAGQPVFEERLERLRLLLDQGIDVKRRIIENLRPSLLDHLGLGAALQWHVQDACKAANLKCRLTMPESFERLAPDMEIAIYRIVQESLTNVIKHANAKSLDFSIDRNAEGLRMILSDDGDGIIDGEAATHIAHGLAGMRHRAKSIGGRLDVRSTRGKGTTIELFVPLAKLTAPA